jgi:phosphoribosylglycinamide formyltransferase-1
LQALLDACASDEVDAEVAIVVSHRQGARALERARQSGVPAFALPLTDRRDAVLRRRLEEQLLDLLTAFELDLVVLAGWMLILSADFLARCPCRLINVHPALLPLDSSQDDTLVWDGVELPVLRGAHAVRDALTLELPFTGVSVHYVTPHVDAGPVVLREKVPIDKGDDEETLYRRIKGVEHRLLPRAVQAVLTPMIVGGAYA